MSRSKSPDQSLDKKHKPHLKSVEANKLNIAYSFSSGNPSNLMIQSNKNRFSSISSLRSAKHLKPKKSLKSFKQIFMKSPSNSVLHTTKDDEYEKKLNSPTIPKENLGKIEKILKRVLQIDQESSKNSKNPQFLFCSIEKAELFNQMFDEIIEKDKHFSKYLSIIKKFLDFYHQEKTKTLSEELETVRNEKNALIKEKNALIKEKDALIREKDALIREKDALSKEKFSVHRIVETLSRENIQLSRDLEKYHEIVLELQTQLQVIHQFNPEEIPSNLDNWKSLIIEKNYYADLCKSLKKEIEVYKHNQENFLAKFDELKASGIDISYEFSDCSSSFMEASLILREELISVKKQEIPGLDISKIHNSANLL